MTTLTQTLTNPSIYVACLAAYNNGILHGKWIDLDQDLDTVWNEIKEVLKTSPEPDAEEYAIHDYEGFGSLRLSEYEGIERAHELAAFVIEHEEIGAELLVHFCGDLEDANKALENYLGSYANVAEYAQTLTEETTEIPEHLASYVDYEHMARDIEMNGDIFTIEVSFDEVHIFVCH